MVSDTLSTGKRINLKPLCVKCGQYLQDCKCPAVYDSEQRPFDNSASIVETDPHGRRPNEAGAKLDVGKSPIRRGLLEYFPRTCLAVAEVSAFGAKKYTWGGWKSVPEGIDRYGDAEIRHVVKAAIEGERDKDSGLLHAAHEAWGALARLELILRERGE